jgi:hypothetical protein
MQAQLVCCQLCDQASNIKESNLSMSDLHPISGPLSYLNAYSSSDDEDKQQSIRPSQEQADSPAGRADARGTTLGVDVLSAERFKFAGDDPDSPQTPSSSILELYGNPDSLPGPTGTSKEYGTNQDMVQYGNVSVPADKAKSYEEVRRHMAEGGAKPTKYLAALETRPGGPQVSVYPFSQGYQHPLVIEGQTEDKEAETKLNSSRGVVVKAPENEGLITLGGKPQSAATGMAHELAHAARYRMADGLAIRPPRPSLQNSDWFNPEEEAVVKKIENRVADAHGEGVRDSYRDAGAFISEGLTSVDATDPEVAQQIQSAVPELRNLTAALQQNDDVATRSDGKLINPVAQQRYEKGQDLRGKLEESMQRANLDPEEWLDSDSDYE